jgi:hypothetical protein
MKRLFLCSILLLSATAMYAADLKDFSIYGSVRVGTWLDKCDKVLDDTLAVYVDTNGVVQYITGPDSKPDYHFNIIPYGKFGVKYKSEKIGATFELGIQTALTNGPIIGGATSGFMFSGTEKYFASLRRFFAELFLNEHLTLLVGQDYVPACFITTSNQMFYDNNGFNNTGSLYAGRKPMLEIVYSDLKDASTVGFEAKLAAIKVDTCTFPYFSGRSGITYPSRNLQTNSKFPKMEASLEAQLKNDPFMADLKVAGGFQQYLIKLILNGVFAPDSQKTDPVNCYVMGFHGGIKVSSASLQADFALGQNLGPYGVYIGNPFVYRGMGTDLGVIAYPFYGVDSLGELKRSESKIREADIIAGFKASSWLSFEGGMGWVHASLGDQPINDRWHDTWAGYFQAEVKIMDQVTVTPEIGEYYFGPRLYYGRILYAGLGICVDF